MEGIPNSISIKYHLIIDSIDGNPTFFTYYKVNISGVVEADHVSTTQPQHAAVEDHPLVGLLRSDGAKAPGAQAAVATQGVLEKW